MSSLAILEKALGVDHPDVARTLNNLAALLQSQGDYDGARPLYERSLAIGEKALGPNHLEVAATLNNLAALLQSQGDYHGARRLLERSLNIGEKTLGPEHPEVANNLNNLAALLQSLDDYNGARALYERSLAILEKALGVDHPEVARVLDNLAALLQSGGDYVGAHPLYERSLAIREKTLGPNHARVTSSLNNLASVQYSNGDSTSARPLFERSLAIREKVLGPEHLDVATSLNNLAVLLDSQGDYDGARPLYERSLVIQEASLGVAHPEIAGTLNNLAALLQYQGKYVSARALFERSLAIGERAPTPNPSQLARTRHNLAVLLKSQGDFDGARPLYESSLEILEKALGRNHSDVARARNNLAALLQAQGDFAGARPLYERSLTTLEEALGVDHPDVAGTLNNLASLLQAQGDYEGARALYEGGMAIREKALGADDPRVAGNLNNLATLHHKQGNYGDARPLYERSLAIRESALGPDHPKVASSLVNLGALLESQGDRGGARPLFERSLTIREARLDLLATMSEREAFAYVAESRRGFHDWLEAFDQPADSERAWSNTLRWKGVATRRMRDRAASAMLDGTKAQDLSRRLRKTRSELAHLTFADYDEESAAERLEQQHALSRQKEQLERALAAESAQWRHTQQTEEAGAADVCAALPDRTALLDFLRYGNQYLAFAVVAPECEVHRIELGDAESLETSVKDWRAVLANDPPANTSRINRRGERVRERVWDPLESAVAGADSLIVVPDGSLFALPFGALPMAAGGYLLERYPIGFLENAQDLLRLPAAQDTFGALLVGDVDFGSLPDGDAVAQVDEREARRSAPCVSSDYKPLKGTATEVGHLEERWAKGRHRHEPAEVLVGTAASEPTVYAQMSGKRVVHLATHGFFADEKCKSALGGVEGGQSVVGFNPMLLSGVVLAGANADHDVLDEYDGILTAEELSAIDLRGTELVVLSAWLAKACSG